MATQKSLMLMLYLLAGRKMKDQTTDDWDYTDTNKWIENYPTCQGNTQSPINLDSYLTIGLEKPPLKFVNYETLFANKLVMVNNGHSAKIVFPETVRGVRPTISGGLLDDVYEAESMHFHWGSPSGVRGSEHTINGQHFDVELHIVHKDMKYGSKAESKLYQDGIAVLAFMFEIVDYPPTLYPGLNKIFNKLPRIAKAGTNVTIDHQLSLDHFLGDINRQNFFAYRGSLTTPYCSESVVWHVFPKPLLISRELIQNFFLLKQSNGAPLINNFRSLQALNKRPVYRHKGL